MTIIKKKNRDAHLETLRGLAALSVLCWHSMLGFFPAWAGVYPTFPQDHALIGTPIFGFIFGTSAVAFFFVLSGYVLTRPFFVRDSSDVLIRNAIKRWPRLALPVAIVVLLSWVAFHFHLYRYADAAKITGSGWLAGFGGSYKDAPFEVRFWDALKQGFFTAFFCGDSSYDSSIWSMSVELIGSFVAFALALFLAAARQMRARVFLCLFWIVLASALEQYWYIAFIGGVVLAAAYPRAPLRLSLRASIGGIALAMFMAGYSEAHRGVFRVIYWLVWRAHPVYVWTAASMLLIICVASNEAVRGFFSRRAGRFLGWISFPLYLLHVPMLCFVGSAVFVRLQGVVAAPYDALIAVLVSATASILAAMPLALVNDRWLGVVNRMADWVMTPAGKKEV